MTDIIYEYQAYPLPEWARWMAKTDNESLVIFHYKPEGAIGGGHDDFPSGWIPSREDPDVVWDYLDSQHYAISGPWFDTLRRIIRLDDPAYYCAQNEHTDDHGFLRHDGGPMPEHVRGKSVEAILHDWGQLTRPAGSLFWLWDVLGPTPGDVMAYKIVTAATRDGSEKQGRQVPPHRSGGGGSLPPLDVPAFLRDWRPRWGAEGRDAGGCDDEGCPHYGTPHGHGNPLEERRHRDQLAARLGVPVPGCSEWLRAPLREARRVRYREASLTGPMNTTREQGALKW